MLQINAKLLCRLALLGLLACLCRAEFAFDLNEPAPLDEPEEAPASVIETTTTTSMRSKPFSFGGAPTRPPETTPEPQFGSRFMGALRRVGGAAVSVVKKLPDYFDFDRFQRQFKREYESGEFLYRKSVFLKRCLRVFKSKVAERLGKGGHVEEVNKFSDRSPNEIKRMFMSGPPMELRPANESVWEYKRKLEIDFQERQAWDAELESQGSLDGLEEDKYNPEIMVDGAAFPVHEKHAQMEIELMLGEALESAGELADAIRDELRGRKVEKSSRGSLDELDGRQLPWPGQQKSSERIERPQEAYKPPKLAGPADRLDWSKHECFHTIYDQKEKCGKCYVMATTALAEFLKCTEEPNKVDKRKFSKEFVLDCGQKYKPSSIFGCKGGSMLDTSRFIGLSGIYNIRGWRTRLSKELGRKHSQGAFMSPIDEACPLDQFELDFENWGEIKIEMNPVKIAVNEWYEALQDGPLVASVQMPNGVENYKSGTHNGDSCDGSKNWHTMILVGYGQDADGVDYWRFRNSFGPDWGDQGHFNLAMSASSNCLIGGVRFYREPLAIKN